jgi:hypothetical protein
VLNLLSPVKSRDVNGELCSNLSGIKIVFIKSFKKLATLQRSQIIQIFAHKMFPQFRLWSLKLKCFPYIYIINQLSKKPPF